MLKTGTIIAERYEILGKKEKLRWMSPVQYRLHILAT